MEFPPQPSLKYDFLADELSRHGADAYVHVGDRFDEMLTYLTRFNGPDRDCAFVYVDGTATLCPPDRFGEQGEREFPGDAVDMTNASERPPAEERAHYVLERAKEVETVLLPEDVTYRTVQRFQDFGYDTEIGAIPWDARSIKNEGEQAQLAAIEEVSQRALARAETILAEADASGSVVEWDGDQLTTERLRREINAVIAHEGGNHAGSTVVGAGTSCADLHFNGDDLVNADETVLIDLGLRGPHGYYGDISRTFVPGTPGEWELEAFEAVSAAFDGAMAVLEEGAGVRAGAVQDRVAEELAEYGYETGDVEVGLYHGPGHGIGISIHEPPFLSTDDVLRAGHVITVEPGVYDPEKGGVRLEDMLLITEDGYENFVDYPKSLIPVSRER